MDIGSREFGLLVCDKLRRIGATQELLAGKLKLSKTTVSEFLRGKNGGTVTSKTLQRTIDAVNELAAEKGSLERISPADLLKCEIDDRRTRQERNSPIANSFSEAEDALFHYSGGSVNALRLWGSSHLSVFANDLRMRYIDKAIAPPVRVRQGYIEFIDRRKDELKERNIEFFNGPCARLLQFRANPEEQSASEKPILHLDFAPVGWYEYSFIRHEYDKSGGIESFKSPRSKLIGLDSLLLNGDVSKSKTSNIVDTATTIITNDGFAGYQARSGRVSVAATSFTSAVAENINRWKDECLFDDTNTLRDPSRHYSNGKRKVDNSYIPEGPPNPFWTVRRGINSELADNLSSMIGEYALRLSGISFDLDAGHPDLLFVAFIDLSRDELAQYCRQYRGSEDGEGKLRFVPANFDSDETQRLLASENWTAGGKASFVRALEYLNALLLNLSDDYRRAFQLACSDGI